ncbi:hypothetical protein [uncultured Meiothermus sp.]|uniref:hypothetical protein n=1 Tax=uncultured Meiothermus sp. TaxID=157471 RepID=UPI0026109B47|nr:hypothetical protein [uncultured Meiothermus sp.]
MAVLVGVAVVNLDGAFEPAHHDLALEQVFAARLEHPLRRDGGGELVALPERGAEKLRRAAVFDASQGLERGPARAAVSLEGLPRDPALRPGPVADRENRAGGDSQGAGWGVAPPRTPLRNPAQPDPPLNVHSDLTKYLGAPKL